MQTKKLVKYYTYLSSEDIFSTIALDMSQYDSTFFQENYSIHLYSRQINFPAQNYPWGVFRVKNIES